MMDGGVSIFKVVAVGLAPEEVPEVPAVLDLSSFE